MGRILLFAMAAVNLLAADATGKWTGTLTIATAYGGENPGPAYLVLQQDGKKLTGTAGPNAGEQLPIQNGAAEDGRLTFEIAPQGGAVIKFVLKQDGDEIKGDVEGDRGGQKQSAKLAVKRDK
jgi:hypothetical protein